MSEFAPFVTPKGKIRFYSQNPGGLSAMSEVTCSEGEAEQVVEAEAEPGSLLPQADILHYPSSR